MTAGLTPKLDDRLSRIAAQLAAASHGALSADDLLASMHVTVLEGGAKLSAQTEAYIVQRCRWQAQKDNRHARMVASHEVSAVVVVDDEEVDVIEAAPAPDLSPEDQLIDREDEAEAAASAARLVEIVAAVRAQLTPRQAEVMDLLMQGDSKADIARKFSTSRANITILANAIGIKLVSAGLNVTF